jgi:hypothetical protein
MQAVIRSEILRAIGLRVVASELTCLADVLRFGHEYASLYLATKGQIADKRGVVPSLNIKGELRNYRFISMQITHPDKYALEMYLIGERGPNSTITMTSCVQAIDMQEGLVRTNNSTYRLRLDQPGVGEPPLEHLVMVCRMLHEWGLGPAFNVPRV